MIVAENIKTKILVAGCIIALVVLSAFLGLTLKQDEMIHNYIHLAAKSYFESILITRRWNANYGGVYVLKKEGMQSNPYLEHPDITTAAGVVYTLKNPALMTREISEMAKFSNAYQYHITSLNLLNPSNAPDPWERESLLQFTRGVRETTQIMELGGKKVCRLMRPIMYEAGCVRCHGKQGYAIGDVRGGISIALVLTDLIMPKKNGREAYEEMKKLRPDIRAVFMSGYTRDIITQKDILEEGAGFISKPLTPTQLLTTVRKALGY